MAWPRGGGARGRRKVEWREKIKKEREERERERRNEFSSENIEFKMGQDFFEKVLVLILESYNHLKVISFFL